MNLLAKGQAAVRSWLGIDHAIAKGTLEIALLPAMLDNDNAVILEIGCNDGSETLEFLRCFGPGAKLYAFEPEPRAIKRFKDKVNDPRCQLFEVALSDTRGTTEFYSSNGTPDSSRFENFRPDGWDLSGSLKKPKKHLERHPWCRFDQKITVHTRTLDDWAQEYGIGTVDFMWVDVQGAENLLFRGATETLQRTRFLYTEYSNRELYEGQLNLEGILTALPNFEVVRRYEGDVLLRNRMLS
jgi:2-O-methyltransferase